MGDWNLAGTGGSHVNINTGGSSITANASANTKGAWLTIATALGYDIHSLHLVLDQNTGGQNRDVLVDIGIGGAGSEVTVVDNILYSLAPTDHSEVPIILPLFIPRGTRVAARIQASTGSTTIEMFGFGSTIPLSMGDGIQSCQTVGANTADSGGTSIDPGATPSVYGSWVQLVAATERHVKYMNIALGNQLNAARTVAVGDFEIGIGAAASEIAMAGGRYRMNATVDSVRPQMYGPIPVSIPQGTRVAMRTINYSTGTSPARLFDAVAYLFG